MRFLRQKRPFHLTRGGWVFILYTIGVGAGAINTGNNLLYLIFGLFLGLILASGVLSDLTLWGVTVDMSPPVSGRAGEPLYIPIRITNTKRWFFSLSVQIELEGDLNGNFLKGQAYCASLNKGAATSGLVLLHPQTRGRFRLTAVKTLTRFPFGLLIKSWRNTVMTKEILILPRLLQVSADLSKVFSESVQARFDVPVKGEGVNLYGVREYQAADNPKRIHWRASAKLPDGWLVKEMERESDHQIALVWPERRYFENRNEDEMERFVSFAATLIDDLEKRNKEPFIFVSRADWDRQLTGSLLWKFLALVGRMDESNPASLETGSALRLEELFEKWRLGRAA